MRNYNKLLDGWTGLVFAKNPELSVTNAVGKIINTIERHVQNLETVVPEQLLWEQGYVEALDFVLRLPLTMAETETGEDTSTQEDETV